MKKSLLPAAILFAGAVFVLMCTSCGEDEESINLKIQKDKVEFESAASRETVTVETNAETWKAEKTGGEEWVTISQDEGSLTVFVTAFEVPENEYEGEDVRSAVIRVSAPGAPDKTITVSQKNGTYTVLPATPVLTPNYVEFDAAGRPVSTDRVTVSEAEDWDFVPPVFEEEDDRWLTVKREGSSLLLGASEYRDGEQERTISIQITTPEGTEAYLEVCQTPVPQFDLSLNRLNFEADGKPVTTNGIRIATELEWNAVLEDPSVGWLRVNINKAESYFTVSLTEYEDTEFPRAAVVVVSAQSDLVADKKVTVTQYNTELIIDDQPITGQELEGVWKVQAFSYDDNDRAGFEITIVESSSADGRTVYLGQYIPHSTMDYNIVFQIEDGHVILDSNWRVGRTYDDKYRVDQEVGYFSTDRGFAIVFMNPWVAEYDGDKIIRFPRMMWHGVSYEEWRLGFFAWDGTSLKGRVTDLYSQIKMEKISDLPEPTSLDTAVPYHIARSHAGNGMLTTSNLLLR